MPELLLDGLLAVFLVGLGVGALVGRTLTACTVSFVLFGVLLAVVWARLHAVDLALAEAAIGAGLMGTLLFTAIARTQFNRLPALPRWPSWILALLLVGVLAVVLLPELLTLTQSRSSRAATAGELAHLHTDESGVSHSVTAVLLNFRAWDTMLELVVLIIALLGIRQLKPLQAPAQLAPWPVLSVWSRLLAPPLLVVAAYVLWHGSKGPGGAFQAGALLAAGAVLLRLCQVLPPLRWSRSLLRAATVASVAFFLAVAVATSIQGNWLEYPRNLQGPLILLIETLATVSIAVILTLLVAGDAGDLQS